MWKLVKQAACTSSSGDSHPEFVTLLAQLQDTTSRWSGLSEAVSFRNKTKYSKTNISSAVSIHADLVALLQHHRLSVVHLPVVLPQFQELLQVQSNLQRCMQQVHQCPHRGQQQSRLQQ